MKKRLLILSLLAFSQYAAAQSCTIPSASALPADYDWNRSEEKNACLRQKVDAPTDYYMLSLSFSPAFCSRYAGVSPDQIPDKHRFQCAEGNSFGWVAHGLWAQTNNPQSCSSANGPIELQPRYCGGDDIAQLPAEVILPFLCTQPGAELLQGEWEKHGTCGEFATAKDFFAKTKELYDALVLPEENLKPPVLFQWLREHNPGLQGKYIGYQSKEIRICYDKSWSYTDCQKK